MLFKIADYVRRDFSLLFEIILKDFIYKSNSLSTSFREKYIFAMFTKILAYLKWFSP